MKVISHSSPILLRSILSSLFVGVDVEMKERHKFCDVLTDRGPLTKGQVRIHCFSLFSHAMFTDQSTGQVGLPLFLCI